MFSYDASATRYATTTRQPPLIRFTLMMRHDVDYAAITLSLLTPYAIAAYYARYFRFSLLLIRHYA